MTILVEITHKNKSGMKTPLRPISIQKMADTAEGVKPCAESPLILQEGESAEMWIWKGISLSISEVVD